MRRFRTLREPKSCHPLVRNLIQEMNDQRIGILDVAERAGVAPETIKQWCRNRMPRVDLLDACFNVLGKRLLDCWKCETRSP